MSQLTFFQMSKTYKICIAFILITLFYNNTSNAIIISEISYENKYNHLSKPVVAISPEGNYVLIGNQVQEKIFFASNTGKILWEKELPPGIEMESGDISIDGDIIVVGGQGLANQQNYVFAYRKDGLLLWKKSAYGEIPVFISDYTDMIYFADNNEILKCYNQLGVPEWSQIIDTKGQKIFKITTSGNGEKILLLLNESIILCDKNGNVLDKRSPTPIDGCINFDGSILSLLYSYNSKKYLGLFDIENTYKIIFEKEILDYGSVSMDEFNNTYLTVRNDNNYLYDIDGNLIQSWINGGYNIAVSKNGEKLIVGKKQGINIYNLFNKYDISDSDGDGVIDQLDMCPGTQINIVTFTDKNGCPISDDEKFSIQYIINGLKILSGFLTD